MQPVSRGLRALTEPPGWGISVSRSGEFQLSVIKVAALGSCGGAGRLDQGTSQPLVACGGAYLAAFTGRLVVTGAQASPRRELSRGGEAAHVRACLGDDDLDAGVL